MSHIVRPWFDMFSPHLAVWQIFYLSGACQVDVAVSTSSRHADVSNARRLAVDRPKLRGRRSSSTVLSQDCLGLSTLRMPVSGRIQNARRKSSGMVLTGIGTTEMSEERQATSTDRQSITRNNFVMNYNFSKIQDDDLVEVCTVWMLCSFY